MSVRPNISSLTMEGKDLVVRGETDEPLPDYLTFANDESAPATAAEEIAEGPTGTGEGTSRVSDLEREMARLLGEITSKRGG